MKRIVAFALVCVIAASPAWAGGRREKVPAVQYMEPMNDSVVDLGDQEGLLFTWKKSPVPSGGREKYKFELFKDFSYTRIISVELDRDIGEYEVSSDTFVDDGTYTWQVRQRDSKLRIWSMDKRWSFKVRK